MQLVEKAKTTQVQLGDLDLDQNQGHRTRHHRRALGNGCDVVESVGGAS